METKHTPDKWVANTHALNRHQVWCNGTKIAACDNSVQSEIYRKKTDDEMDANAKLIAAAPELLEALQCICNILEITSLSNKPTFKDDFMIAQAAINKAIGHE